MQSDFNHIDDFFRKKEEEASADNSMQDRHWQQMKGLLVTPATPSMRKIRTWNPKLLWQLLAGFSFIAVVVLLVWKFSGNKESGVLIDSPVTSTTQTEKVQTNTSTPTTSAKEVVKKEERRKQNTAEVKTNNYIVADSDQYYTGIQDLAIQLSKSTVLPDGDSPNADGPNSKVDAQSLLTTFFNQLKKREQGFVINPNRDTTIYCTEGTTIFIPAKSFQDENGIVNDKITFNVQEFYEIADIIGNKLNTTSDGNQLATGGMLNLTASIDGKNLSLKKGASLKVQMPTRRFDPEMQLFYGKQESQGLVSDYNSFVNEQEAVNWNPAGQKQFYFDLDNWTITVTDWANDPRDVVTRRGKKIAKFIVPDYYSDEALEDARAALILSHGWKYDEIKIRRGWKRQRDTKNTPMNSTIPTIDGMVGEQLKLTLKVARSLELISASDSARHAERAKMIIEKSDSLQRQYLQLQNQYTFNINTVGWINCDKFLASMGPRTQFTASTGDQFKDTYFKSFLIFKDMNSILDGNWMNGKLVFDRVPVGKRVTLVCVGIKDGKAYSSMKETSISPSMLTELEFVETTPEKFRKSLEKFGNVQRG